MRKIGYTLSEVLVALAVVGFISAMTIPTVVSLANSSRRPMFRSAYRMLEVGVSQMINDSNIYPGTRNLANPLPLSTDANVDTFCEHFANLINTIEVNCGADPAIPYSFISSNGMVWMGLENVNTTNIVNDTDVVPITVDIDGLEKGQNTENSDQFIINVAGTGKITIISDKGIEYLKKGGIRN